MKSTLDWGEKFTATGVEKTSIQNTRERSDVVIIHKTRLQLDIY